MAAHNELGKLGEDIAVDYLKKNGYEIIVRNWKEQDREIDIIAKIENTLVFVEVKARSSIEFGLPQEFVKQVKIKRLVTAADLYIEMNHCDEEIRFDIIAIHFNKKDFTLAHLEDAFYFF